MVRGGTTQEAEGTTAAPDCDMHKPGSGWEYSKKGEELFFLSLGAIAWWREVLNQPFPFALIFARLVPGGWLMACKP